MITKQLSLFLENKPGVLATVCRTLARQNINILAMSISDTVDHAVVRLLVDDPHKAVHILGEHGALVVETDVLAIQLDNKPGQLATLTGKLARGKVNIEYAYGSGDGDKATLVLRVGDAKKAMQLLAPKKKSRK